MHRREFIKLGLSSTAFPILGNSILSHATAAPQIDDWNGGDMAHLIPTANDSQFLIKASFTRARSTAPQLIVNDKKVTGQQTDRLGRFWQFHATGLEPATSYELKIVEGSGSPVTDRWPLRTFPAPGSVPDSLRILAFTCAGGSDGPALNGKSIFLDMAARKALLNKGLASNPDLVIANGDHIYWDIETSMNKPFADFIKEYYWLPAGGALDLSRPMLDPRNVSIFHHVCDHQIASLYGVSLRSVPSFFLSDDHDMFENDEYDNKLATMPPDSYGVRGAQETQLLYYPEFLPDRNRPNWLEGANLKGRMPGTNMINGSIRYGDLLEVSLYDCRRHANYKGNQARLLTQSVENWLLDRTLGEDTLHYFHAPSLPFAYSSGKLGDWYPDVLDSASGKLVTDREKAGWQQGWYSQHQKLLEALGAQKKRNPLIVQGDFHASAAGRILASGDVKLDNPVHVVMSGTLGTGDLPFPSSYRSVESGPSAKIAMEQTLSPVEKNGFSVIDVTPDDITISMYNWRPPQPVTDIETMAPALVYKVPRV